MEQALVTDSSSDPVAAPAHPAAAPLGPDRTGRKDAAIEWLRFWASLGIVCFHMQVRGAAVAYGGLPVFVALSSGLAYRPASTRRHADQIRRRIGRYLGPWLFWSIAYLGLHFAAGHGSFDGGQVNWATLLLVGGSLHLWYLPFACVATIVVEAASHQLGRLPRPRLIAGCAAATALGIVLATLLNNTVPATNAIPLAQWILALPAVPMGLVFFRPPGQAHRAATLTLCCAILLLAVEAGVGFTTRSALAIPYFAATCACGIGWLLSGPAGALGQFAGRLSFGIYLLHPMMMLILARLLHHGLRSSDVLIVIPLTIVVVVGLLQTPVRRVI